MIITYKPELQDLWFRQQFLADEDTMSYNHAWGGTILFPESAWKSWYEHWLVNHEGKRYYRYLKDCETASFVGEIAYHYDEERKIWLADVIIASEFRGKGFGSGGLQLLCEAAAANGIDILRDDIAIDNPAIRLFLKAGFAEEYRTDEIIMLKRDLDIEIEEISLGDLDEFWTAHIRYLTDDEIVTDSEDIDYFSGSEYRDVLQSHMLRDTDKHHMIWFKRNGERIGAASYCIYQSEDGKCFILDFWVFPEYRGNGTGHRCFDALEKITKTDGAAYYEINSEKEDSICFWKSLGFEENGKDEYDVPLFIKQ